VPAIVQVEPLTTARALRGPFDYRLPDDLRRSVGVGSMLVVPFGRQELLGVVVGLSEHTDVAEERLLAPRRALELGVPADLVDLAAWIAREFCSTPARALTLMLPPGAARGAGPVERLVAELTAAGAEALGGDPPCRGTAGHVRVTAARRAALERLADGPLPATATGASHAVLRGLADRGLVRLTRRAIPRRPPSVPVGTRRAQRPALTPDQAAALATVAGALAARRHQRLLLHGVTGSGKTEVYLRAAELALRGGRGAIVLVPEIALTPQISGRFTDRFGDTVAVLHSRLSEGQRHDEWRRLRSGEARVCVGPRSAVFAPIEDLGLVVVDEEHDASYKHEGDPRYDARSVAEQRAARADAVLVAGSATPRPESFHRLDRLRLGERVDGRALPPVAVLDMRDSHHALHPETARALADLRAARGKAIVLLNRRGWSNFLTCRSCGRVWSCPDCDVSLVLHRGEGAVACHHCGHREPAPDRCPACASVSVARHGAGTERLEHELTAALDADGSFPIFRLDADAVATRDGATRVLARFQAAPSGVLVGTQMVAKGHDFPDVGLGVVIDADATLRFPDFRAEERTFALVAQLAGRAGRGGSGRVLVQTIAPQASAIVHAARHDSEAFLAEELGRRAALRYPPFSDLIRVVCAGPEPGAAQRVAGSVRERLQPPGADVLGPAPLFRLRGKERSQLVIKAADRAAAVAATGAAVAAAAADRANAGVSFSVDVDPQ
jgi:primosomal protein N' (replication factor Y)